jgi:peptidoglycan pentaglycine glycine transferase (the first glycine)
MQTKEITDKKIWDAFLDEAQPSSFLHSWEWGLMEQALGRPYFRLGIYNDGGLIAVAAFTKIQARRGTFLLCSHGPIVKLGFNDQLLDILNSLRDAVRVIGQKERCHFIRISTITPASKEHEDAFHTAGFRDAPIHMHAELTSILKITSSEEELLKGMRKQTRYSIKKAEKDGVTVERSTNPADLELFWQIYESTFKRNHFTPFSKEYLSKEFSTFMNAGKGILYFAKYNNERISSAFVIYSNGSGFYHHGASLQKYSNITASHLIQWEAIREAKLRGCTHYNFWGMSPEGDIKHPWYGYSLFKKGFGGYYEEYVHAKDYILSTRYWLTYIIERIRKIKRGL